jgi:hypothetical protein
MSRRLLVIRGARFSRSSLVSRRVKPGNRMAGLILAPLVAATPAWVPILFGRQWRDVVVVIPPASATELMHSNGSMP